MDRNSACYTHFGPIRAGRVYHLFAKHHLILIKGGQSTFFSQKNVKAEK